MDKSPRGLLKSTESSIFVQEFQKPKAPVAGEV